MNKNFLPRALFVAGALALAGTAAQADAIFYPDGTMVELGDSSLETTASLDTPMVDTTVLGGPAAQVTATTTATTTTPAPQVVYVQPNIDFDRAAVLSQIRERKLVLNKGQMVSSVATPQTVVVGSTVVPYAALSVDQPYYVLSF